MKIPYLVLIATSGLMLATVAFAAQPPTTAAVVRTSQ
jgi:hypothetical protein